MIGSYAGAMGQPQFMPSSYLRYAVDFEGNGRRDIWTSKPDVLGSIANYLQSSGWRGGECGPAVILPPGFAGETGRDSRKPVRGMDAAWRARRQQPPARASRHPGRSGPAGRSGREAFLVYGNFAAIRRYNPPTYYALAVGLLGDSVVA